MTASDRNVMPEAAMSPRMKATGKHGRRQGLHQKRVLRTAGGGEGDLVRSSGRSRRGLHLGTWRAQERVGAAFFARVDGTEGSPSARSRSTSATTQDNVQGCPVQETPRRPDWLACTRGPTRSASRPGRSANCARLACICVAVPSNSRPQPAAIRLSPVKAIAVEEDRRRGRPCGPTRRSPAPASPIVRSRRRADSAWSSGGRRCASAARPRPSPRWRRPARPRRPRGRRGDASAGCRSASSPAARAAARTGAASGTSTTATRSPDRNRKA